jgi:Rrf2 family transcriptional regulator, iron-sulfur cluster assembly transcription factor
LKVRNSSRSRYAVAALVDLAQSQTRRPVALAEIAQRQSVSVSYLEQVFALLRQNGFVKSVRGPGGGYLLARGAEDIRISDVFTAFAAAKTVGGEGDESEGSRAGASVSGLWDALDRESLRFLSTITVKDVADGNVAATKIGKVTAQAAE